ncbi:MAG: hypothetical protein RL264_1386 [Bacteroidota bacterium]|jgi:ribosomal protein S18 acetylase RimI-like enzyme
MNTIQIRSCKREELSIISDLAYRIWPLAYKEMISQQQMDFMLNWMYSLETLEKQFEEGQQFFIAEENVEPVGFIAIEALSKQNWKIQKLYVLVEKHGRGIGKFLLQKAIDLAKKQQVFSLELQVNRENKAVEFYKKMGFTIREAADFDIGNGFYMNDYVMEIQL